MTVIFPFCAKDADQLERLLEWIRQLGSNLKHSAVLLADGSVQYSRLQVLHKLAGETFQPSSMLCAEPVAGWIRGSNSLFKKAATKFIDRPFLWVEPDAVPTRATWLDEIEADFSKAPDKFLGALVQHETLGLPNPYLEGCAVYPTGAWTIMEPLFNMDQSWTLACAPVVVPKARSSPLFQHFWGQAGLVPTFVPERSMDRPDNGLSLSHVKAITALFHRNKDGSLIRLLRDKIFPVQERIIIVFPVCNLDVSLATLHATWLQKMNHKSTHGAVISADANVPKQTLDRLTALLTSSFSSVGVFRYPTSGVRYPHAANLAWQQTARFMERFRSPWFWCEADAVALKPDWIEQLQLEYDRGRRPFMGVVVPGMGHLQGTAIYPHDAARRMPAAMSATSQAFDMEGQSDVAGKVHEASRLMFHVWTIANGQALPVGGGEIPRGITADQLRRWLPKEAVFLHRIKDASVLNLLMTGAYAH